MVEMRWVEKSENVLIEDDEPPYVRISKVLQMRQGAFSEWIDVPVVEDEH